MLFCKPNVFIVSLCGTRMRLRLSIGSAIFLGIRRGSMECLPTTCYVMLGDACRGACGFCTQSRHAAGGNRLSRVVWPDVTVEELAGALDRNGLKRICVQTLDYHEMVDELVGLASMIPPATPMSAAVNPLSKDDMLKLRNAGVERIGIGLDAASREVYNRVKGMEVGGLYTWDETIDAILCSREVFGHGMTHIIVGLGEKDRDIVEVMSWLAEHDVGTSLFAFTPVREGSVHLSPPPMGRYRSLQAARELIMQGARIDDFAFEDDGRLTTLPSAWPMSPHAFSTRGCPGCNRPYYNESPGDEPYNHPCVPTDEQVAMALHSIGDYEVNISNMRVEKEKEQQDKNQKQR